MPIDLKCYATLAAHSPENAAAFPIKEGETVGDVVRRLSIPEDEIKIIFINGISSALDQPLADGDRVGLFPPVGGG